MKITTKNLIIRPMQQFDEGDYVEMMADKEVSWPYKLKTYSSKGEIVEDFKKQLAGKSYAICLKNCDKMIGVIYFSTNSNEKLFNLSKKQAAKAIAIEFALNSAYHGKGYMTEAIKPTVNYIIEKKNISLIVACNLIKNIKSANLQEKLGMREYDTSIYSMARTGDIIIVSKRKISAKNWLKLHSKNSIENWWI